MLPWTRQQLAEAIDRRRPVATPVKDRHFPDGQQFTVRNVQLDIRQRPEGLAVTVSPGVESHRAARHGWETQTITIPRFSEHDMVRAADQEAFRLPGRSPTAQIPLAQHVNQKLDAIRARFDRTMEYMAVGALRGEVKDGDGNVIATYPVENPNAVKFYTDSGGDDPYDVLDDKVVAISRELGGMPGNFYLYAGKDAYKALRNQHRVQDFLQSPYGPQMLAGGELAQIAGINIQRMPQTFVNNAGQEEPFVPDDEIILATDEIDAATIYGPCETPDGSEARRTFVDQWDLRDPAGTVVRLERNPFPLLRRPGAVRRLKVTGSGTSE